MGFLSSWRTAVLNKSDARFMEYKVQYRVIRVIRAKYKSEFLL